jgi:carbamoyl-phosphate synthase large subunit
MRVVNDGHMLRRYMENAHGISKDNPILIDRFLQNALEVEADAISDGKHAFVPAVMEHIELAGVHSGDSACVLPSVSIPEKHLETIKSFTKNIAVELGVKGLLNIQYAIENDKVYILEANPRASRTVPLVSKVCDIRMVPLATKIIMSEITGDKVDVEGIKERDIPHFGVKEAVFPFNMFPEVDPLLGPEMLSTGEVLGISDSFGAAFYKAEEATGIRLPLTGSVFISVADKDKEGALEVARELAKQGFKLYSTKGTAAYFGENGVAAEVVNKLHEGGSSILSLIASGEISLIVNTHTSASNAAEDDSYIRKAAIQNRTPFSTTIAAALASAHGIADEKNHNKRAVKSLQQYHKEIK